MDQTLRRITDLVSCQLPGACPPDFSVEADLRDAGLSSMGIVALLVAVESEFHIEFPPDQITLATFNSVASLYQVVQRCLASEKSAIQAAGGVQEPANCDSRI